MWQMKDSPPRWRESWDTNCRDAIASGGWDCISAILVPNYERHSEEQCDEESAFLLWLCWWVRDKKKQIFRRRLKMTEMEN